MLVKSLVVGLASTCGEGAGKGRWGGGGVPYGGQVVALNHGPSSRAPRTLGLIWYS